MELNMLFTWLDSVLGGWKKKRSCKNSRLGVNSRRLVLEQLGERIVPSAVSFHAPMPSLGMVQAHDQGGHGQGAHDQGHALSGSGHGTYTSASKVPDTGVNYTLQGVANLSELGPVTVTGSVHSLGFILTGQASGTLTFTNLQGSVTIHLTGPVQEGFSALPKHFSYTVTGGTGAYAHLEDHGSLDLILQQVSANPGLTGAGTFTISLNHPQAVSGIDGQALVGPISPVERPGVSNTRPLAGAVISIETADGTVVAKVTADENGRFHIRLAPGRYRLVPLPPKPGQYFPRGTPQMVVVTSGETTHVTVNYDSGIR
jgi:hypothetical protein